MPTYEYACTACGQHIEVFQRLSEEALTTCGVCGGPLRKVFHPAGIVFKGSGFYATDNRSKPKTGAERSTSAAATRGERTDASKAAPKADGSSKAAASSGGNAS